MIKNQSPLDSILELEETMIQFGQSYQECSLQNQAIDEEIRSWNSQALYLVSSEEQEIVISQLVAKLKANEWLKQQQPLEIQSLREQLNSHNLVDNWFITKAITLLLVLIIISLFWYLKELILLLLRALKAFLLP